MKFTPHLFQPWQRNARECNSCLWRLHRACHGSPQLEQSIPSFWRTVWFEPNMFSIFFPLSVIWPIFKYLYTVIPQELQSEATRYTEQDCTQDQSFDLPFGTDDIVPTFVIFAYCKQFLLSPPSQKPGSYLIYYFVIGIQTFNVVNVLCHCPSRLSRCCGNHLWNLFLSPYI